LKPKSTTAATVQNNNSDNNNHSNPKLPPAATTSGTAAASAGGGKPKPKGFGLLGNLVGAQRRTNQQVVTATAKPGMASSSSSSNPASVTTAVHNYTSTSNNNTTIHSSEEEAVPVEDLKTSGQILSDFRNEMEQKMLDFDIAPDMSMKVSIKLSDHVKNVVEEDKPKITMEVLKYIVYEQAEEVNDEWIAHKEPSEFMDEIMIAIYKDPEEAPPEVLEELNKAEIPEEQKAQQKMVEAQRRQQEMKALRAQEQLQREALKQSMAGDSGGDDLAVLNTQKRDRRTLEDYQRGAKRQKGE
jgi:hypothetical protein